MENKSLAEIVKNHKSLDELLVENGGELSDLEQEQIIDSWMSEIKSDLSNKADGYKYKMDQLESASEVLRDRAKMISLAAKTVENMSDNLKSRMKQAMNELGLSEIISNDFKFKLSPLKPKLVLDSKLVDSKYEIPKMIIDLDKESILKDLESGLEVAGAKIEPVYTIRVTANKKIKELNK